MRSAVEWAQIRTMAADGVVQCEIAAQVGINRWTVKRLVEADVPPRYERGPAGPMIVLSIKACQTGHRVAFATAQQRVDRLETAQHRNALDDELRRLERYHLLVVDEVGCAPRGAVSPGGQRGPPAAAATAG